MVEKLAEVRLLAMVCRAAVSPSAVLAGLIPVLACDALAGSASWHILPRVVPGSRPLHNLAQVLTEAGFRPMDGQPGSMADSLTVQMAEDDNTLARLAAQPTAGGDPPLVLVIDQFEETFTLCADEDARRAYVANLLGLTGASGLAHRVILTMRSDYESWVSRISALQEAFDAGRVLATTMTAVELRRAIVEPANIVGLRFQDGIVDTLISEMLGEPAALPLLQFTLRALWNERRRNRITWDIYKQVGGGRTALARAADHLYNGLIPVEQGYRPAHPAPHGASWCRAGSYKQQSTGDRSFWYRRGSGSG